MDIIPPDSVSAIEANEPDAIKRRKANARSIAAIGSWNAELELRNQERAYKSARKGDIRVSGVSDSFPYQVPKHRRANQTQRRKLDYAGIAISYTLRDRSLYFYGHDVGYYFSAYKRGYITRGELDEFITNLKLMGRVDK